MVQMVELLSFEHTLTIPMNPSFAQFGLIRQVRFSRLAH